MGKAIYYLYVFSGNPDYSKTETEIILIFSNSLGKYWLLQEHKFSMQSFKANTSKNERPKKNPSQEILERVKELG
jgi:hypothetical protein